MFIKSLAKTTQYLTLKTCNRTFTPPQHSWIVDRRRNPDKTHTKAILLFLPAPNPIKLHIVTILQSHNGVMLIDPMRAKGGFLILKPNEKYDRLGNFLGADYEVEAQVQPPYPNDEPNYIEPVDCVSIAKRVSVTSGEDIITPMRLLKKLWEDRVI